MTTDWTSQLILARFQVDLRLPGAEEAYRAWDNQTNQAVTLHVLPETDDESRRQLETRIHDLERVVHPGILPYLGLFQFSGQTFWVEGYVDGPTLRFVLNAAAGQPLPLTEALIYLKCLAAELAQLHELGWAHTRLSPENVRLDRAGQIYLTGLFSAQRLGESRPPSEDPYSAPEEQVSTGSDVYALAVILFELLSGLLPSRGPLPDLRESNPNVPEFVARMLPKGLEADPAARIPGAMEFFLTACLAAHIEPAAIPGQILHGADDPVTSSGALLDAWNYLPPVTPPPSATARTLDRERRRPPGWVWLSIAGIIVAGVLLLAYALNLPGQTQPPAGSGAVSSGASSLVPVSNINSSLSAAAGANVGLSTDTPVPTINAPDGLGGLIVFTCTRDNLNQLCMVKPTGGDVSRLTAEAAHDFYPSFSPDGGLVLFASNRTGHYNLFLKLLGADTLTQITNDIGEVSSASFSPDGKQIIFSNSVNGAPSSLWAVDRDGKNPRLLYKGSGNIANPIWSPNGKSIAFAMSTSADQQSYDVFILDTDTNTVAPVTKGTLSGTGGSVDWSPDGRFLLLFAGKPGDNDIYTFEIVSGAITRLTKGGNNAAPAYSPDGRWIVFNSQRVGGNANIFIMRPDGSDVRQLTNDTEPDWQPRWGR